MKNFSFIKDRDEIKNLLQKFEYGTIPEKPTKVYAEELSTDDMFCAGKAPLQRLLLKAEVYGKEIAFPIEICKPLQTETPEKTLIYLNFFKELPNKYFPMEEITDRGWTTVSVCYEGITSDDSTIDNNACILLNEEEKYPLNGNLGENEVKTGKIAMWAWGVMRVVDYLYKREDINTDNLALIGHSRLGKTALLAAAFDERISFVHSNDSGASGAALYTSTNENCEKIYDLATIRPYWFSEVFRSYIGKEKELPFDQHHLLGLIAPRVLSVGSAEGDPRANPQGEMDGARVASVAWSEFGEQGLIAPDKAETGVNYHDGKVGYYIRKGCHYHSREDWSRSLAFFEKYINNK